jgi:hypothetical protein
MSKTPEELAFNYAANVSETRCLDSIETDEARLGFLAGYQAGFDAAITTQTKMGGAIDRMIQLARKGSNDENT